jgi:hypothetical protein
MAELWHDAGDMRDRQIDPPRQVWTNDMKAGTPTASCTSSPTLVDPSSPTFVKRQKSVTFSFDGVASESHDDVDIDTDSPLSARHPPDPVPWRTLLPLLMFLTADAMTYSVLFPIITDMLTSFRPPIAPDMIGLYAGLGEGVMMLVEAVCSTFWARAADKYGRRGCLIYGFSVTVLGSLAIGWSRGVATIIVFRSLRESYGLVCAAVQPNLGSVATIQAAEEES